MILRGVGYPRVIMIPTAAIVGMVHVRALPGTPAGQLSPGSIAERAVDEAKTLADSGCDAVLLENMHDVPYLCGQVGPEVVAAMTTVAVEIRRAVRIPVGLQILAAANLEALAVAHAAALHFVRAEHFAYAHVADEGMMLEASAGPLLRSRKHWGAESIKIFADVQKKHAAHAITNDLQFDELVRGTRFCGCDGVIVTGSSTGQPTNPEHIASAASSGTTWVGSGATASNLSTYFDAGAEACIVGSSMKCHQDWREPLDRKAIDAVIAARDVYRG